MTSACGAMATATVLQHQLANVGSGAFVKNRFSNGENDVLFIASPHLVYRDVAMRKQRVNHEPIADVDYILLKKIEDDDLAMDRATALDLILERFRLF